MVSVARFFSVRQLGVETYNSVEMNSSEKCCLFYFTFASSTTFCGVSIGVCAINLFLCAFFLAVVVYFYDMCSIWSISHD